MTRRTRILLYGNSLVLSGIGASLRAEDRFEVITVSQPRPFAYDVKELDPDVVVFDSESPGSAILFSAFGSNPDLLLLGVGSDSNIVRSWSGRQYRELSTRDLAALIEADSRRTCISHLNTVTTKGKEGGQQ